MAPEKTNDLKALAEVFAFLGNSLLAPINQTPKVGLDPAFWAALPDFGNESVRRAVDACGAFAETCAQDPIKAERDVATEYARLFIGPPRPAAPPWESAYVEGAGGVGFGAPTFAMRALLRDAGLRVDNENNQYEDHIGIELLLLSVLLERTCAGQGSVADAAEFAREHPANWVCTFVSRIDAAAPGGYYANMVTLAEALLSLNALR